MTSSGSRVAVNKEDGGISITVKALKDDVKQRLLLIWILFWSAAGVYVIIQLFGEQADQNIKIFLIVWLGFWAYFENKTLHAYRWRNSGKEVIHVDNEKLTITKLIGNRGIPYSYKIDYIKNIRVLKKESKNFFYMMNDSYWSVSGERLTFDYQGKTIAFGMQLEEKEANSLCNSLKQEVNKRKQD